MATIRYAAIKSFGGVTFPTYEGDSLNIELRWEFNTAREGRIPVAGKDGFFDLHGTDPAPRSDGLLTLTRGVSNPAPGALLDDWRTVSEYYSAGLQKLIITVPDDSAPDTGNDLYVMARVVDNSYQESYIGRPDSFFPISISFQVPTPVWLEDGTATTTTINATGTSTTATVTNAGNAITIPEITITPPSAQTAQNVSVKRIVSTVTQDEITYTTSLTASDTVTYDPANDAYTENATDIFGDVLGSFKSMSGFRLLPGDNSITVEMANVGDQADVTFTYRNAYV